MSVVSPRFSVANSTYRLQFHRDFPFSAALDLLDYLAELGVTQVYSSPILTARAGSMHGYDVVDFGAINPELGGEDAFRALAQGLRDRGMGLLLDIVPNHMAVGGDDNAAWLDLLKNGRTSVYARRFDIDFDDCAPDLVGKVHAPFLGEPYRDLLLKGDLKLIEYPSNDGFAIRYGEHLFPIRTDDEAAIRDAGLGAFDDAERLDALLARQNFALDWWRNAGDRINWRRFFDVTSLAAVRMEDPETFEAGHAIAFRLYREGLIDGLRIDHVDGLKNPAAYCHAVRRRLNAMEAERPAGAKTGPAWLLVEKILAPHEDLAKDWQVDGTTGYDFMNQVSALQHAENATKSLSFHWTDVSGRTPYFEPEEIAARRDVLDSAFDAQRERLVDRLIAAGAEFEHFPSITRAAFRRAITALMSHMRVYRVYATGEADDAPLGEDFQMALDAARDEPLADQAALEFLGGVISGETPTPQRQAILRRFNQLSAPLAAKAVEDTAFYRYGRLLSRNDVGFEATALSMPIAAFHDAMKTRARDWPSAMLTTATHDHKRGEDVRARLAVVSEIPDAWIAATTSWFKANTDIRPADLDAGWEYQFYQTIVGAWPLDLTLDDAEGLATFMTRMVAWREKSIREAKLRSSWSNPNVSYEADAQRFVQDALDPSRSRAFLASAFEFIEQIASAGAMNSLVQVALRCMAPGAPDLYQGAEFWDFSLVDPDNRRPVDFATRASSIAVATPPIALLHSWREGRFKQMLLRQLLVLRGEQPDIFAHGDYQQIEITGVKRHRAIVFTRRRGSVAIVVAAALHAAEAVIGDNRVAPPAEWWGDTAFILPGPTTHVRDVLGSGAMSDNRVLLSEALSTLPVAVWALDLV